MLRRHVLHENAVRTVIRKSKITYNRILGKLLKLRIIYDFKLTCVLSLRNTYLLIAHSLRFPYDTK